MKSTAILILLLLSLSSCFEKDSSPKLGSSERVEKKGLSLKVAKERKASLSNISYIFNIDLTKAKDSESFKGTSQILFNLDKSKLKSSKLIVDFEGGEVSSISVNSKEVSDFTYNKSFISFPSDVFEQGKNSLKITFIRKYSTTGSGLYKFTDKTDQKTYVYTDFEPYDANQFAPLFDQPNLKAVYSLNVKSPKTWTIISSVKEQIIEDKGSFKKWSFPKSQKFSTYIFSLHGGPYAVWSDSVKLKSKTISLKLFARQSLAKHVKPEFWFKITKQGFNFFEQYFSTDYPYTKYDQVLVPDFNSGAMENVAAVTFSERLVSREKVAPRNQRRGLANIIFHEMAHMWFGNLVTMDWWNDLWLNESFATFMAFTGLKYNTEYTDSWVNFYNRTKQWAYAEDQWRTTHPIETEIPSTEEASSNFDGITYGKGASSLKQLVFLIGEENFKKGLADYFKAYAEKNTIRENFISSLQAHTKEDLSSWTKEWLQTKGLNSLSTEIVCKNSKLEKINFTQGVVSGARILRTHKLKMAIWTDTTDPKSPSSIQEVKISGANTSWKPTTKTTCPSAVFPNWGDHGFIQVNLDTKTFEFFKNNINKIDSSLLRVQYWAILNTMLKLGKLAPEELMPVVKEHLPNEKDLDVMGAILNLTYPMKPIFYYYKNKNQALAENKKVSDLIKKLIPVAKTKDQKKILFDSWLYNSYKIAPHELAACLKKCNFDIGFDLDIDRKWRITKMLAALNHSQTQKFIADLFQKDSSQRGTLSKLAAEVRLDQNKKPWLDKALDKGSSLSLKKRITIIRNLIPFAQREKYFEFAQKSFFERIDKINDLPKRIQKTFARSFRPLFCGDFVKNIPVTEEQIQGAEWEFGVKKTLLQELDREERCLKIKKMSKG